MRIPEGVILLWFGNEADIPEGWVRESLLDGLFPKGWGNQPVNQTGGSPTHTHTGLQHCHNLSSHQHYIETGYPLSYPYEDTGGDDPQTTSGSHHHVGIWGNTDTIEGGQACATINWANGNNIPPYKDVIFIRANSPSAIIVEGIGGLFNKDAPTGWVKPSGYNQKFLRGANAGANAGGEGGSYTHMHDLTHSHSHAHRHTGETGWPPSNETGTHDCQDSASGGFVAVGHSHRYWLNWETINYPAFSYVFTSPPIQPVFKKLLIAYRTANGILGAKGLIGLWLGDEASVPKGWVICDGRYWSDGRTRTPDLRNYFIKLTTDPNRIGETSDSDASVMNSHDHPDVISHTHGAVSHNHGGSGGSLSYSIGRWPTDSGGALVLRDDHLHEITRVDPANVSLLSADLKTDGNPVDNQPPYRTVIFIQLEKVGAGGSSGANLL